jgi:hypothetical protein
VIGDELLKFEMTIEIFILVESKLHFIFILINLIVFITISAVFNHCHNTSTDV